MKKYFITILLIIFMGIFLVSTLYANDNKYYKAPDIITFSSDSTTTDTRLVLESYTDFKDTMYLNYLYLVNTSNDTLTVFTRSGISTITISGTVTCMGIYFSDFHKTPSGYIVIPDIQNYKPVTLKPGEAARIKHNQDIPIGLKVTYSVPKSFENRFGVWSGYLETKNKKYPKHKKSKTL